MNTNERHQIMDGPKFDVPADSNGVYGTRTRFYFGEIIQYTLINFINFTEFQ